MNSNLLMPYYMSLPWDIIKRRSSLSLESMVDALLKHTWHFEMVKPVWWPELVEFGTIDTLRELYERDYKWRDLLLLILEKSYVSYKGSSHSVVNCKSPIKGHQGLIEHADNVIHCITNNRLGFRLRNRASIRCATSVKSMTIAKNPTTIKRRTILKRLNTAQQQKTVKHKVLKKFKAPQGNKRKLKLHPALFSFRRKRPISMKRRILKLQSISKHKHGKYIQPVVLLTKLEAPQLITKCNLTDESINTTNLTSITPKLLNPYVQLVDIFKFPKPKVVSQVSFMNYLKLSKSPPVTQPLPKRKMLKQIPISSHMGQKLLRKLEEPYLEERKLRRNNRIETFLSGLSTRNSNPVPSYSITYSARSNTEDNHIYNYPKRQYWQRHRKMETLMNLCKPVSVQLERLNCKDISKNKVSFANIKVVLKKSDTLN